MGERAFPTELIVNAIFWTHVSRGARSRRLSPYLGNVLAVAGNDACHEVVVAGKVLGGAVVDDVRAVLDGADEVAADTEGVVDDEGDAMVVSDLGNSGDVKDVKLRVCDALDVDRLGLLVDRWDEVLGVRARHEPSLNPVLLERDLELVVALKKLIRSMGAHRRHG